METETHNLSLGEPDSGELHFTWSSGEDLEITSIVLAETPIHFTFDLPIVLSGSNGIESTGVVKYTVQSPENACTAVLGITSDCVYQAIYPNTFQLSGTIVGETLELDGGIEVNTRRSVSEQFAELINLSILSVNNLNSYLMGIIQQDPIYLAIGLLGLGIILYLYTQFKKAHIHSKRQKYRETPHKSLKPQKLPKSKSVASELEKTK